MSEKYDPLMYEIRDQIRRVADQLERLNEIFTALTFEGKTSLNVEIGEPRISLRDKDLTKVTDAIRGYMEK